MKKIKCVIVDDDPFMQGIMEDLCKDSQYAEIVAAFTCPEEFLKSADKLDFELCLLDIMMEPMDGFAVARSLKNKQVIFITGVSDMIPDALDFSPIDVIKKPIPKERFEQGMKKAYYMILGEKSILQSTDRRYELFRVAELSGKIKLATKDIIYVRTDKEDRRNKHIWMGNKKRYTLMDYTLDEIMNAAPQLIQANISELLAIESVHDIEGNIITLEGITTASGHAIEVTLGRTYKSTFLRQFCLTSPKSGSVSV